ncbi:hypothetical protein [Aneurinibacillus migulanus]|uniref:hypothetical protein n=1 Tax=Aneurinibacillus migulanus TaxID=47500 RepID=UPI00126A4FE6|nr:hypothetical protein [Aneurinibacillus migulanus]
MGKSKKYNYIETRVLIIQYDPEWIATTPCPKRAAVRLSHGSVEARFLPQPGGTAKHLGRREEGDSCGPLSPGRGMRSGRETKGLVCVPLWWSFPLGAINRCDIEICILINIKSLSKNLYL